MSDDAPKKKKKKKSAPKLPPLVKATRDARRLAAGTLDDPKAGYGEKLGAVLGLLKTYVVTLAVPASLVLVLFELPMVVLAYAPTLVVEDPNAEGADTTLLIVESLYGLVTLIAAGAVVALALQHREGGPLRIGASLKHSFFNWLGLFASDLFGQLISGGHAVLGLVFAYAATQLPANMVQYRPVCFALAAVGVIPGIVRYVGYAITYPLVLSGEAYGVDSLNKSQQRLRGHRWVVFGALIVAQLPWLAVLGLRGASNGFFGMLPDPLIDLSGATQQLFDAVITVADAITFMPVLVVSVAFYDALTALPEEAGPYRTASPKREGEDEAEA